MIIKRYYKTMKIQINIKHEIQINIKQGEKKRGAAKEKATRRQELQL